MNNASLYKSMPPSFLWLKLNDKQSHVMMTT